MSTLKRLVAYLVLALLSVTSVAHAGPGLLFATSDVSGAQHGFPAAGLTNAIASLSVPSFSGPNGVFVRSGAPVTMAGRGKINEFFVDLVGSASNVSQIVSVYLVKNGGIVAGAAVANVPTTSGHHPTYAPIYAPITYAPGDVLQLDVYVSPALVAPVTSVVAQIGWVQALKQGLPDLIVVGTSRPLGALATPYPGVDGLAGTAYPQPINALPDLLAASLPNVNVYNSALGSSLIASSPGYYDGGEGGILSFVAQQVTPFLQGGPVPNVLLIWSGINDVLHSVVGLHAANPSWTQAQLFGAMSGVAWTRMRLYLNAVFAVGVKHIVICTEPSQNYFSGASPQQPAANQLQAEFNASALAYNGLDPRVTVVDLASASGMVLTPDQLHYADYHAMLAYLLPYLQALLP